jgi:hypothetical protein
MRRFAFLGLLVLGVGAAVMVPLASASGDAHGPPCSNITNGGTGPNDGFYANPDGTGTFNFSMTLAAPACTSMTYTFYVSYDGGAFTALTGTAAGAVVTMPTQNYPLARVDIDNVCVYATSAKTEDGEVADRAPNDGCQTILAGSAPAGGGFN